MQVNFVKFVNIVRLICYAVIVNDDK